MPLHLLRSVLRRQNPRLNARPLIMADKMATYSPADAKVLNVEPIVSIIPVPFPLLGHYTENSLLTEIRRSRMDQTEQDQLPRPIW
jgi:hypothetical protein